jgi:hypothetical protein
MFRRAEWVWEFFGFESIQDGRPVQDWYDGLPISHKTEIVILLLYLRNLTSTAWDRPFFDSLKGEGGISEILVPDIRDERGVAYYRVYGYFGPGKQMYTFLHATNKKVRNDKHGKGIAKHRLKQLQDGRATIHKFNFEERPLGEPTRQCGRKN